MSKTKHSSNSRPPSPDWDQASQWYDGVVAKKGHYFHQSLLIPKVLEWLKKSGPPDGLVDLGCGQGVLARAIDKNLAYLGIDSSELLLKIAKRQKQPNQRFILANLASHEHLKKRGPVHQFSHGIMLLSLQNMADGFSALLNAKSYLNSDGHLLIVLNHPCFRIPRQSSWRVDEQQMVQSRCVNAYMSPLAIPILTNPGRSRQQGVDNPKSVISYHQPLSTLSQWLFESGFLIAQIQEWTSHKISEGRLARAENRARREIPLFLALHAVANSTHLTKK